MKVSLNLAQYYSNVDLKGIDKSELVKKLGLQLGAVEEITDCAPKYKGIVVAKVVSCEKHPNADKLKVCKIDDGGVVDKVKRDKEGHVQVVCGAPNVEEGMLVAWIPPKAVVPSTYDGDQFVLEARELRGEVSNGMIASAQELDISDDHEGILEVKDEENGRKPKVGEPLSKYYGLDDFIVDCENKMFTHRPDCFGNLGVAREIAGIFGKRYVSPDWYLDKPKFNRVDTLPLSVENSIPELVPRFTVVAMQNIKVGASNTHTQGLLKRVGIKPINNVVDITNYVMHVTGQPLHAFDYDKLLQVSGKPSLHPRMAKKGEKITLLGNKQVTLEESDIVISTDKQVVAIAGVMGGADTEVDENTKNIVIECANFDMYSIRRSSMHHGLFTDAVTRFNKGQSPLQNDRVIAYAIKLMGEFANAKQASNVYDLLSKEVSKGVLPKVKISVEFINSRLGSDLTEKQIKTLLENVEFSVSVQGQNLEITVPFWRMDIAIKEDIVEEVGRLYGYNNLPVVLPNRTSMPSSKEPLRVFTQQLREKLTAVGGNEVLTYSFVHGDLMKNTGTDPDKTAYHLRNALSPDLQYYRTSLLPSLLAKVHSNIKAQAGSEKNEFALFEFGKAHVKGHMEEDEPTLPKQMRRLSLVITADTKTAKHHFGAPYYLVKKYLDYITDGQLQYTPLTSNEHPITSSYQIGRSAVVELNGVQLGVIGEIRGLPKTKLKLPEYCAGFELDMDLLFKNLQEPEYRKLSVYPESTQDITFEVKNSVEWATLHNLIDSSLENISAEAGYEYLITPMDIYKSEKSQSKRISFHISVSHQDKTLRTEEVNKILDKIAKNAHEKLKAVRI